MTPAEVPRVLVMTPVGTPAAPPIRLCPPSSAVLGRASDCQIQFPQGEISKHHARIAWSDGAWQVTDLQSHNGTSINQWPLTPEEPVFLHDGDTLALGSLRFEVSLVAEGDDAPKKGSGTWATRASIFGRLRDERADVRELGWEEFRKRYAPVIVGFSRNAGLPAQDADDVLQDVMLGFFRLSGEFRYDPDKGRFRAYLKRATLNAMRKRARRPEAASASDERLDEQGERSDDAEHRWEEHWAEQIFARALEEAGRRFDARTIEAFELYGRWGVPAGEVAARLGLNVNSVHQAKSRVLNFVRAVVDRLRAEEG